MRIVERWLLGKLRRQRFYSLADVNAAIAGMLKALNDERVLRAYRKTRRQLFEEIDLPHLKPLPAEPFVLAQWKRRKAGIDYHVEFDGHFYSIPYRHARTDVELRATRRTVEIFLHGDRIACHLRGSGDGKHTTLAEHMPSSHRRYAGMTPAALLKSADAIGPNTALFCQRVLERRPHPEQGFRTCLGVVRMAKVFGSARLEATCERALEIGALSYGSVKSILDTLDGKPVVRRGDDLDQTLDLFHPNIRGSTYYH